MNLPRPTFSALLALGLTALGCHHVTYTTNKLGGTVRGDPKWHHNFVYFIESAPVNLALECPYGFTEVTHQVGFGNSLARWLVPPGVGWFTRGNVLWQPSEYTVACLDAPPPPAERVKPPPAPAAR